MSLVSPRRSPMTGPTMRQPSGGAAGVPIGRTVEDPQVEGILYPAVPDDPATAVAWDAVENAEGTDVAHQQHTGSVTTDPNPVWVRGNATAGSRYHGAWRFPGVIIPQGAEIEQAVFQATIGATSTSLRAQRCTLMGWDTDDAASVGTPANWSTDGTDAKIELPNVTVDGGGAPWRHDVTEIVQEIVDRGGWDSGNALVIWAIGKDNVSGNLDVVRANAFLTWILVP